MSSPLPLPPREQLYQRVLFYFINLLPTSLLYISILVLQPGRLAKADELVVDEAILDMVELVHVLNNGLILYKLILYKVLDKSISADGNPKSNFAVNLKRRGESRGLRCTREGSAMSRRCAAACASAAEIPITRILGLSLRARPASSLRTCLMSESTSSATDSLALM